MVNDFTGPEQRGYGMIQTQVAAVVEVQVLDMHWATEYGGREGVAPLSVSYGSALYLPEVTERRHPSPAGGGTPVCWREGGAGSGGEALDSLCALLRTGDAAAMAPLVGEALQCLSLATMMEVSSHLSHRTEEERAVRVTREGRVGVLGWRVSGNRWRGRSTRCRRTRISCTGAHSQR